MFLQGFSRVWSLFCVRESVFVFWETKVSQNFFTNLTRAWASRNWYENDLTKKNIKFFGNVMLKLKTFVHFLITILWEVQRSINQIRPGDICAVRWSIENSSDILEFEYIGVDKEGGSMELAQCVCIICIVLVW